VYLQISYLSAIVLHYMQGRLQLAASINCDFMQNYVFAADLPLVTCQLAATICVLKMIGQSYYRVLFICLCQSKRMPILVPTF
jgi:hypothetical protein